MSAPIPLVRATDIREDDAEGLRQWEAYKEAAEKREGERRERGWAETERLEQACAANEDRLRVLAEHGDDRVRAWARTHLEALGVDLAHEDSERAKRDAAVVPDLKAADYLLDTEFPPPTFAVDPIHPRGQVCEAVGAHGIFKSSLELMACLCVASGRRFGGLPVVQGLAVFITAEDDEATIARRIRAWLESIPVGEERRRATEALRRNFRYLTRENVRHLSLTLVEYGEPGQRAGVVKRLADLVQGAVLVVLETAARLAEGNENENRTQAAFAVALEEIAQVSGAALVIVRHVSKAAAMDGRSDSYVGRGGGALSDAARSIVVFTRPGPKGDEEPNPLAPVIMTHAKSTLTRPAPRISWLPVEVPGLGVYLRPLSADETTRSNARKLLAEIPPEGITSSALHKKPPAGLGRKATEAALALLLDTDRLSETEQVRGATRQKAIVYVPTGREP